MYTARSRCYVATGHTPGHECAHDRILARMEAEKDPALEAALEVSASDIIAACLHFHLTSARPV